MRAHFTIQLSRIKNENYRFTYSMGCRWKRNRGCWFNNVLQDGFSFIVDDKTGYASCILGIGLSLVLNKV